MSLKTTEYLLPDTAGDFVKPNGERRPLPDLVERIGDTPLIRLNRIGRHLPESVQVYAKAEHLNPTGSVKDRAARRMILEGLRSGDLHAGKAIIDATSGNTGIAYAVVGALLGLPVVLAMPSNASPERRKILEAHGAEIILTDPMDGTDGSREYVRRLVDEQPDRYFYPDQYNNDANWRAHYDETGLEILEQTNGRVTQFVAGLGTTGTFMGVARRLKDYDEAVRCVAVEPDGPLHGIEGLKHLESAVVPGIYDPQLPDATMRIATEASFEMTRRLAREEGLLVGVSSGANVCAALEAAADVDEGAIVTILCDSGTRYLSDSFWTNEGDQ